MKTPKVELHQHPLTQQMPCDEYFNHIERRGGYFMSSFTLSPAVDKNKIFFVNYSKLNGRMDPRFHAELPDLTGFVKLSSYVTVSGGKRLPQGEDYSTEETPFLYLRVSDFDKKGDINFSNVRYLKVTTFEQLQHYEVTNNELIMSIAGTIGRVCLIKGLEEGQRAILTENCAKIAIKAPQNIPKFLAILFNIPAVQKQIELSYIQTTIPKLGLERIKNLYIPPIPSLKKQESIVNFFTKEKKHSLQKELQASKLLAGIDDYLLNELGITLPEQDNRLEKRMFYVCSREVSGERLDPGWSFNIHCRIEGGKYPNVLLKDIASVVKGESITSSKITHGAYPVIAGGQSSPYSHNTYNQKENCITVSASGAYSGYVWYHDCPIFASDCSVVRSYNDSEISTLFIAELLKLKQTEIYCLQQGAGQPHVYPRDLMLLKIPVPTKDVQAAILTHISHIRSQATQLRTEAAKILADAKVQVESMIWGDDV